MVDILMAILALIVLFFIWVMIYDSNRFVTVKYEIQDDKIKEDFRMVVIADLHNKKYGKDNETLIEAIKAQDPDAIVIAGDIPTAKPKEKLKDALSFLGKIKEICPIYYGNGNHEQRLALYPKVYGDLGREYQKGLNELGIKRLLNAKQILADKGIAIYGSEIAKNYYKRFTVPFMDVAYLDRILGKPDEKLFNILIAHNPEYFESYAKWGADLTLSGHVHGGVMRVPFLNKGVISPSMKLFPKYDGGQFEESGKRMIISRGLGMHTIPVRLFNPGELVVVELSATCRKGKKMV